MACAISRLAPEFPLPPYAYVRGQHPHPTRDPAGHSFGKPALFWTRPDPERWEACHPYLYGIDLFNYGYYWEAHEVWEGLWHACGRSGMTADLLKGLIALAAAGVKLRGAATAACASTRHGRRHCSTGWHGRLVPERQAILGWNRTYSVMALPRWPMVASCSRLVRTRYCPSASSRKSTDSPLDTGRQDSRRTPRARNT